MASDTATRRGFTLIEVLAASVIAAFLMAAVLGVVTLIVRDRAKLRIPRNAEVEMQSTLDLLRRDLLNARQFSEARNGRRLALTGFGGIDPKSHIPDGRPARVEYRVEDRGGRRWLLRSQRYLDDQSRGGTTNAIVSGNIEGIVVQPIATQGSSAGAGPPSSEKPAVEASPARPSEDPREATLDGDIPQAMTIHLTLHEGATVDSIFVTR